MAWIPASEPCDAADLESQTCASRGFSGGRLRCGPTCAFDTNGCHSCVPSRFSLACRHTELDARTPRSLAMTTSDSEIVLAWVAGAGRYATERGEGAVRVARFRPDLSLIEQSDCFGPTHALRVSLARTRTGFLLAIEGDGGVTLQPLDARGEPRGSTRTLPGVSSPALGERSIHGFAAGGPLCVWAETGVGIRASLLGDDGAEEFAPVDALSRSALRASLVIPSATYVGDGFLVTERDSGEIAHVGLDGVVTHPSRPAPATSQLPAIWNGAEAHVAFLNYGPHPVWSHSTVPRWGWAPIDPSGNAVGPGAPVLRIERLGSVVALGADAVFASTKAQDSRRLEVTKVSADGAILIPPFAVVNDPEDVSEQQLGVLGREIILAWLGGAMSRPGRIGLARLSL